MRKLVVLLLALAACDKPAVSPNPGPGTTTNAPPPVTTVAPPAAPEKLAWARISNFAYTQKMELPPEVTALDGKRVEMSGFLYPTRQVRDLKEFILTRDPGTCCYGPQTQWNHFLQVKIVKGPGVNFTREPITVVGIFRAKEVLDGDYTMSLYELDAEEHRKCTE